MDKKIKEAKKNLEKQIIDYSAQAERYKIITLKAQGALEILTELDTPKDEK